MPSKVENCINCGRPAAKGSARRHACRSWRTKYGVERPREYNLGRRMAHEERFVATKHLGGLSYLHCTFDVFLTEHLPYFESEQGIQWPDEMGAYDVHERGIDHD